LPAINGCRDFGRESLAVDRNKGRRGFAEGNRSAARACQGDQVKGTASSKLRRPGRMSTPRQRAAALGVVGERLSRSLDGYSTGLFSAQEIREAASSFSAYQQHGLISLASDRPQRCNDDRADPAPRLPARHRLMRDLGRDLCPSIGTRTG